MSGEGEGGYLMYPRDSSSLRICSSNPSFFFLVSWAFPSRQFFNYRRRNRRNAQWAKVMQCDRFAGFTRRGIGVEVGRHQELAVTFDLGLAQLSGRTFIIGYYVRREA